MSKKIGKNLNDKSIQDLSELRSKLKKKEIEKRKRKQYFMDKKKAKEEAIKKAKNIRIITKIK